MAGVSLSTVSRVVNGGDGVRADLAVRVREAVELLGYRHNLTASTLRRADRQSASIGLIFEDVSNPFFGAVHRGVEDVARARGVLTLVGSSDEEPERERELADAFVARGVDGLDRRHRGAPTAPTSRASARPAWRSSSSTGRRASSTPTRWSPTTAAARARRSSTCSRRATAHRLPRRPAGRLTPLSACGGTSETLASTGCLRISSLVRHPQFRGSTRMRPHATLLERQRSAHGALHESEPDHDRCRPRATRAGLQRVRGDGRLRRHRAGRRRSIRGSRSSRRTRCGLGRAAAELLFERLDGFDGPSRRVVLPTR